MKITLLTIFLFLSINTAENKYQLFDTYYIYNNDSEWTVRDTYEYLKEIGCKFVIESTAQTIAESGWKYDSQLAKQGNNIIGMKKATKRFTTANGTIFNHSNYRSKKECLKDLVLWQNYTNAKSDYLKHLLNSGYCQNENYVNFVLPNIIKKLKNDCKKLQFKNN